MGQECLLPLVAGNMNIVASIARENGTVGGVVLHTIAADSIVAWESVTCRTYTCLRLILHYPTYTTGFPPYDLFLSNI